MEGSLDGARSAVALADAPADRRTLAQRLRRCMSVSVVTTAISLSTLVIATAAFGIAAWPANVLATSLATVPSYLLNRRWTWGRSDASSFWREVVPFWVMAFAGLALSTLFVGVADSWAASAHLTGVLHTASLVVGHLSGFGALWVGQFIVLDRLVFARPIGASS